MSQPAAQQKPLTTAAKMGYGMLLLYMLYVSEILFFGLMTMPPVLIQVHAMWTRAPISAQVVRIKLEDIEQKTLNDGFYVSYDPPRYECQALVTYRLPDGREYREYSPVDHYSACTSESKAHERLGQSALLRESVAGLSVIREEDDRIIKMQFASFVFAALTFLCGLVLLVRLVWRWLH